MKAIRYYRLWGENFSVDEIYTDLNNSKHLNASKIVDFWTSVKFNGKNVKFYVNIPFNRYHRYVDVYNYQTHYTKNDTFWLIKFNWVMIGTDEVHENLVRRYFLLDPRKN